MSDDLMSDGDLWNALRRMFQRGIQNPQAPVPGIQDIARAAPEAAAAAASSATTWARRWRTSRRSWTRSSGPSGPASSASARSSDPGEEARAARSAAADPAGASISSGLQLHRSRGGAPLPGADEVAQQQMMQPFMQGMKQSLQNMSPDDLRRMREMMRDLNRCCAARRGRRARLRRVQAEVGQNFPGVESLERAARAARPQAGQLQSLLDSMSPRAAPPAAGDDVEPVHEGRAARGRDGPARHAPRPARLNEEFAAATTFAATTI